MKKIFTLMLVLVLCMTMAPAAFASGFGTHPGACQYAIFESNGDGTHTGICIHGFWHRKVETCYSDNNNNGKCDFCAQIIASMEATAGTNLPLTAELLGGFEPSSVNVSVEVDDAALATVETVDGVVTLVPAAEGETFLRVFVSGTEMRVSKLSIAPAPVVEEPAEAEVVEAEVVEVVETVEAEVEETVETETAAA